MLFFRYAILRFRALFRYSVSCHFAQSAHDDKLHDIRHATREDDAFAAAEMMAPGIMRMLFLADMLPHGKRPAFL